MRGGLSGLTTRGRSFLAAGIAASVLAYLLDQHDVLRVGVLLAAVPLVSAFVVTRSQYRIACTRRLDPPRVGAGDQAVVHLRLDNVSRLPTGLLLAEDRVPYVLGSRPRFVLDRVEPQGSRAVSYPVRSDVRGRFILGPLGVRLTDPFGMCELHRSFTATDTLVVTPAITPLPGGVLGGALAGTGTSRARSVAAAGEDDVSTREYRHGDALHRVHWRSTARRGELMVRREEQPWQSRATVLLDTRVNAHRGEGPASSFEQAVGIAASIGAHLADRRYLVRLVLADGTMPAGPGSEAWHPADTRVALLDALAVVGPSGASALRAAAPALRRGGDSLLVAVLGALEAEEAQAFAGHAGPGRTAVALLLDASTWSSNPSTRETEAARTRATATMLRGAGWRVAVLGAGDPVDAAWAGLAGNAPGRRPSTGVPTAGTSDSATPEPATSKGTA
ncbi:DUF58 domain-containing protein [Motilibacter sp. E257]|uniref:DUF58 domain-containing protein n=1 Tax=Motilibacter deserti TaxID=2714956 RepID=A0ABX0GNL4_9ACTN|nr:DUF58 domain-containing protein [Motilibacter deserti]